MRNVFLFFDKSVSVLTGNNLSFCSAVLAHFILSEKLHIFGAVGCILCVVGSTGIVMHAPKEREIHSVKEIWHLAFEPGVLSFFTVH